MIWIGQTYQCRNRLNRLWSTRCRNSTVCQIAELRKVTLNTFTITLILGNQVFKPKTPDLRAEQRRPQYEEITSHTPRIRSSSLGVSGRPNPLRTCSAPSKGWSSVEDVYVMIHRMPAPFAACTHTNTRLLWTVLQFCWRSSGFHSGNNPHRILATLGSLDTCQKLGFHIPISRGTTVIYRTLGHFQIVVHARARQQILQPQNSGWGAC